MQANWIGQSRGLQFAFDTWARPRASTGSRFIPPAPTRCWAPASPAISPGSSAGQGSWSATIPQIAAFVAECRRVGTTEEALETAEKMGFDTGLTVRHPFDTDWELPVYIANFILMDYGTGAIFGCPAHDAARPRIRHANTACRSSRSSCAEGDRRRPTRWSPRPMCR